METPLSRRHGDVYMEQRPPRAKNGGSREHRTDQTYRDQHRSLRVELEDYGIDLPTLKMMYGEWQNGKRSKSAIERRYIGKTTYHGKLFTKLVRQHLAIETETRSPLTAEVARLRTLLLQHGIDPDGGLDLPAKEPT